MDVEISDLILAVLYKYMNTLESSENVGLSLVVLRLLFISCVILLSTYLHYLYNIIIIIDFLSFSSF